MSVSFSVPTLMCGIRAPFLSERDGTAPPNALASPGWMVSGLPVSLLSVGAAKAAKVVVARCLYFSVLVQSTESSRRRGFDASVHAPAVCGDSAGDRKAREPTPLSRSLPPGVD